LRLDDCHDDLVPEPEYLFTLSAERTYLAYVRSALALLAGSVVTLGYLDATDRSLLAHFAGFSLLLLGLVTLVGGHVRFRQVVAAIRSGESVPHNRLPTVLTSLIVVAAVLGILAVQMQ
jgi:putative membrane protein